MGGGPTGAQPPERAWRFPVTVVGVAALAAAVPDGPPRPGADDTWTVAVAAVVAGIALLLLRGRPVLGWATALGVCAGTQLAVGRPTGLVVLVLLGLLVVALRRPLGVALAVLGASCVVYAAADALTGSGLDSRILAPLALMAAVTAAGVAVAGQQALVQAATDRAAVAEQTREDEAERRVDDERLRIARELHDVVAHHVAVMGVQAGAADQLLDTDSDQARIALAQVRSSGRTALAELGTVVGLLRTRSRPGGRDPGDAGDGLPPVAVGLGGLPELLDGVRAAGLRVTVTGAPPAAASGRLGEVADITAYRIVQESLTNAMRHGTGEADVALEVDDAHLTICVVNPVPLDLPPGAGAVPSRVGHGLLGMRERATLVGAELATGPTGDGTFSVRVTFPTGGGTGG